MDANARLHQLCCNQANSLSHKPKERTAANQRGSTKIQKAREGKGTLSRSRLLQPGVSQASVEATWSKRSEWKLQVAQNIQPSED